MVELECLVSKDKLSRPSTLLVRKVRASQGRMPDNVRGGDSKDSATEYRPVPVMPETVRVEGQCKGPPRW